MHLIWGHVVNVLRLLLFRKRIYVCETKYYEKCTKCTQRPQRQVWQRRGSTELCRIGVLLHRAQLHYPPRAAEGAAETKVCGKQALLQLFNDFAPSRCSEGSSPASSLQVVIWELKVWGIQTDLKTPSPRYQLEMFCHFEDAGIRDTGRSFHCHYLWMVLRLCSQVLVTPFLRLSAPLPKFQKSVVLSPQRRSRWSQAWLDWTRPIPEFIKSSLSFVSTNKQSLKAAFPDLSEHFLSASPMSGV